MVDSSAFNSGLGQGDGTAGERLGDILADSVGTMSIATLAERIAYAESCMWKHWHEYCDWKRRADRLRQQQSVEWWAKMNAPAVTPDKDQG